MGNTVQPQSMSWKQWYSFITKEKIVTSNSTACRYKIAWQAVRRCITLPRGNSTMGIAAATWKMNQWTGLSLCICFSNKKCICWTITYIFLNLLQSTCYIHYLHYISRSSQGLPPFLCRPKFHFALKIQPKPILHLEAFPDMAGHNISPGWDPKVLTIITVQHSGYDLR